MGESGSPRLTDEGSRGVSGGPSFFFSGASAPRISTTNHTNHSNGAS